MNWSDYLPQLFELVVFPLLAVATAYLVSLIKVKKQELKEKSKNETLKKYLDMLDNTITACVIATNQTYVESLKQQGSFDALAQKNAFNITYDAVMNILTEDAKEYLNEAFNDLNSYITNKIEAQVVIAKKPVQ